MSFLETSKVYETGEFKDWLESKPCFAHYTSQPKCPSCKQRFDCIRKTEEIQQREREVATTI